MNADNEIVNLAGDARERWPVLSSLHGYRQRRLVRIVRYGVFDQVKAGASDVAVIRDYCLDRVQAHSKFKSIVTVIGIAMLTAIVEWLVKKILERLEAVNPNPTE